MKTIKVKQRNGTENVLCKVDDCDFEDLNKITWNIDKKGYIRRSIFREGKVRAEFLHRRIMGEPKNKQIDHINHDKLDNQKKNLRTATNRQNCMNKPASSRGGSEFKGVHWEFSADKWRARIKVKGILKSLGCFNDEVEAAKAYNEAALKHFGEFAYLNKL